MNEFAPHTALIFAGLLVLSLIYEHIQDMRKLARERDELKAALQPLASIGNGGRFPYLADNELIVGCEQAGHITIGHVRTARRLLGQDPQEQRPIEELYAEIYKDGVPPRTEA